MNVFLDHKKADEAKLEALAQVYAAAPETWKAAARQAIWILAYCKSEFVSDDVWRILYKPPEARALGPVMTMEARAGIIERAYTQKKTAQVSRHHTDVNVWRSLVFGKTPPPGWASTLKTWQQFLSNPPA